MEGSRGMNDRRRKTMTGRLKGRRLMNLGVSCIERIKSKGENFLVFFPLCLGVVSIILFFFRRGSKRTMIDVADIVQYRSTHLCNEISNILIHTRYLAYLTKIPFNLFYSSPSSVIPAFFFFLKINNINY